MRTAMTMALLPQLRCALAPELRQSLRLLQLPTADVIAQLREAERDNPLIELEWRETNSLGGRAGGGFASRVGQGGFKGVASGETLEQDLLSQIRLCDAPISEKRAAAFLAGNLSADGYLEISVEEAVACTGKSAADIESGLRLLQALEPAGVGARTLEECLRLQASRDAAAPDGVQRLIREHLPDVAGRRWKAIAKSMGTEETELRLIVRYLRGLNPRPGAAHRLPDVAYVIPEAKLSFVPGRSDPVVKDASPIRLRVRSLAGDGGEGSADWRTWHAAKRKEAFQLQGMLRFRADAMRAVISAIAVRQHRFLSDGPVAILPMKLEQIADATGYHLSTVSRAVREKYVETPFGVLPLSRFFSVGLQSDDGTEVSARSVKYRIRSLIERENKSRPLTDRQLADALLREGIAISRRTVAKYREEERLLPSAMRGAATTE